MVQPVLAAVTSITVIFALAACGGGSAGAHAGSTSQIDPQTTVSEPAGHPDKLTGPAPGDRVVHQLTGFISPSGNVSGMIDADWPRCDITDRDWSPPARPADCKLDYGQGISLAPGEQADFVCAGDTAFGADEVPPYGESITARVLRCESAASGVTCRDLETAYGFSISRQAYRLF